MLRVPRSWSLRQGRASFGNHSRDLRRTVLDRSAWSHRFFVRVSCLSKRPVYLLKTYSTTFRYWKSCRLGKVTSHGLVEDSKTVAPDPPSLDRTGYRLKPFLMSEPADTGDYSHSIVLGGLELMSYTTRLTPLTSLMIRVEIFCRTSWGIGNQSAVMKSSVVTARTATTSS